MSAYTFMRIADASGMRQSSVKALTQVEVDRAKEILIDYLEEKK